MDLGAAPSATPGARQPTQKPRADEGPRRVLAAFVYSFQEDTYGKHWVLHDGDNLVGRAETSVKCDVPIAHGTTSTRHATITANNGQVAVTDLKSTNGTYVNGRRIEPNVPTPVNHGDKIRFGGFTAYLLVAGNRS
jgi:pSer/pThr/pTyr-binding forkhead associated (FHA) protein